jgi:hypothetical protein
MQAFASVQIVPTMQALQQLCLRGFGLCLRKAMDGWVAMKLGDTYFRSSEASRHAAKAEFDAVAPHTRIELSLFQRSTINSEQAFEDLQCVCVSVMNTLRRVWDSG